MTVERRAGAPRLIDWTGERCVPWTPDIQVAYEHYHRYLWAAQIVAGRKVLDLGSGEGFGSAILAGEAESVTGIDVDPVTVDHAQLNYAAPNLEYAVGSALELDRFDEGGFGAVVAFEVIEHLEAQDTMLDGIERVLAPGGLLIVSTPDRRVYTEASGQVNPFHERELSLQEFEALLGARFAHLALWGQRAVAGSRLGAVRPARPGTARDFTLERAGDAWRTTGEPTPMYLAAVASREPLPEIPDHSHLADAGLELVRAQERRAAEETGRERALAQQARAEADAATAEAARSAATQAALRADADVLLGRIAAAEREVRDALQAAADERERTAGERVRLKRIDESVTWRLFERTRGRLFAALGGPDSRRTRSLQASLRTAGRALKAAPQTVEESGWAPIRPIHIPAVEHPLASIIIPVHARPDLTEACLRAIVAHTDGPSYEVIVVDDRAPGHEAVWAGLEGATVIHNEENLGYLRNNNLAAAQARGEFLVLLNNDTEVQQGWLRSLVGRAESDPRVGAVVPRLLYPDGSLQEAGGIIFSDATGANYGRGRDPELPEYSYAREVDYGSAACLLVRTALWREIGGFDERFLPMYYEDTDLCFAVRRHGASVWFEPAARVIHVEGATAGTDTGAGSKRFQEVNRPKFAAKWADELAQQFAPAAGIQRRASNRNRGPHVLIVDHRLPSPDRDSGSVRMQAVVEGLLGLGCRVTFLPDNEVRWEPYAERLQELGVEVLYAPLAIPAEIASIGAQMRLAIVSRPYVAGRHLHLIREHAPSARIVYDTVDLHYVRERRRAVLEGANVAAVADYWERIELALAGSADVTAVVSEEERAELERALPGAPVVVLPNANRIRAGVPGPEGRDGLLFVGSFEHQPNVDAALWLVRRIMPLVWRGRPDVTLKIVGGTPPPEVEALEGPSVAVTGWVEDLDALIDAARVMVAPLRYGAGMKGKVTQSLAGGLPVVTTAVGAEGLDSRDGDALLIADDPGGLAERIVRLAGDDALWRRLAEEGRGVVERTCSPALLQSRLAELLDDRQDASASEA